VLVKHIGFSFSDVCQLTFIERHAFLKFFQEEQERQKEELKKAQNKSRG